MELVKATDAVSGGLIARPSADDDMRIFGKYFVECRGEDGSVKWSDTIDNLITTVGKNDMLDKYLAGSAWTTGTVYMGLKGTGTAAAGDTMASHATWSELNITSSSGARLTTSFSAASSGSKATSAAVSFSVTSSGTVAGCFLVVSGAATNGSTTGILFSAGDFSSSRAVVNGDTLNVTYTATLT